MYTVLHALTASLPEGWRPVTSQQEISQMTASVPRSGIEQKQSFKRGLARVTNSLPSDDTHIQDWVVLAIVSRLRQRPMPMVLEELADGPVPTSTQNSSRAETILHLQYSLNQLYKSLPATDSFRRWLPDVKAACDNMERHWASPTSHDQVPSEEADEADPASIPSTST